jgi:hypothetical protein
MALKLSKELDTGVTAEYWAISEIRVRETLILAKLQLFLSKEAKDAGKTAIETKHIELTHVKSETSGENIYQKVYNAAKASKLDINGEETNELVNAVNA